MDEQTKNVLNAISYILWPIGLVTYLIAEEDKEMKYHGAQGLTFGLALTIIWYLVYGLLGWAWLFFYWIANLLGLVFLILAIIYAVKAYKKERFQIPVIYDIMRKFYKEEGATPTAPVK